MQFGALFPQQAVGTDSRAPAMFATTAERLGCSYLLTYDHVLNVRPPDRTGRTTLDEPFHEPLVLLGHLAAVTESLELVTGILVLPQRQTAVVAKQAAEVAILSDGRLRLGVGVGWNDREYDALGMSFKQRGARIDKQIPLLRRLWTEDRVSVNDRWHQFAEASIAPHPPETIPVWIGGGADIVLRRIARLGDGWIVPNEAVDKLPDRLARLQEFCTGTNRALEDLSIVVGLDAGDGNPDHLIDQIQEWDALGISHVTIDTSSTDGSVADHLDVIAEILDAAEEAGYVLPREE